MVSVVGVAALFQPATCWQSLPASKDLLPLLTLSALGLDVKPICDNACGGTRADASHPEGLASAIGSVLNVIWLVGRVCGPVASGEGGAKLLKSNFALGDFDGDFHAVGDEHGDVHMIPL